MKNIDGGPPSVATSRKTSGVFIEKDAWLRMADSWPLMRPEQIESQSEPQSRTTKIQKRSIE